MEPGQNKNKNILPIVGIIIVGAGYALFENFKRGVPVNSLLFTVVFMAAFVGLLIWRIKAKQLTERRDSTIKKKSPLRVLVTVVLIFGLSWTFRYFLNQTKYGADWQEIYSAELQDVPESIRIERKDSIEQCVQNIKDDKDYAGIDVREFCECGIGNVALKTTQLTEKGVFPSKVDEAGVKKYTEKIVDLSLRLNSLCYCEQKSVLPGGEACPK